MPDWPTNEVTLKAQAVRETLRPLTSVTAAASRLTTRGKDTPRNSRSRTVRPQSATWQDEAWDMLDLVGELHFLHTTLANRIASGALYVGEIEPGKPTAEPVESDNELAQEVLGRFGTNHAGRTQIVRRMAMNLLVAGEVWLLGLDENILNQALEDAPDTTGSQPIRIPAPEVESPVGEYAWRALSVTEISPATAAGGDNTVEVVLEDQSKIVVDTDAVSLVRVWRPHDRRAWEADCATKASLPVLRELVGLTMHVAAQIDSRLAGAGILMVKESVQRALKIAAGLAADDSSDPVTDALIETMTLPIQDRDLPSAVVPLIVTVPDEIQEALAHLNFSTPLDAEARNLRDEAIRRLALSQDAPPEVLLGTAPANHWGAWLINEETVTIHVEPPLALICDALTTQYLWPALIAEGMSEDEAHRLVVWYSVDHMVVRPNQFGEAKDLYEAGLIDGDTYRRAGGFDLTDSPEEDEEQATPESIRAEAVNLATELVRAAPSLMTNPGLPQMVAQIEAVLSDVHVEPNLEPTEPVPAAPVAEEEEPAGELPTGSTTDGPPGMEEQ